MFRIKSYHAGCHVIQQRYLGFLWIDKDGWGLFSTTDGAAAELDHHLHRIKNYPKYSNTIKL